VAGQGANCSNHPGHCGLTSVTIHPYPFHCSALTHSRKEMGKVNQHHYLRSFPTVDRMCSSAGDPTPATPTGFGNPLQGQPYCQPSLKDEMGQLQQGRDCGFTIPPRKSTHVNLCLPLRL
jgi:hypothetical protein